MFPPSNASIDDDATLLVRGTVTPPSTVSSVTVGGVAATSADGFATWTASVPLALGANTITIDASDLGGNLLPGVGSLAVERKSPLLAAPSLMAFDEAGSRAFTFHGDTSIIESNLTTGATRIVSSATVGSGPALDGSTRCLAWDATAGRIVAVDADEVLGIAPTTGARAVIASAATGTGGWPQAPRGCVVQPGSNRLLVTDSVGESVWAIALSTGNRTILSSATVGTGNPLAAAYGIDVDDAMNRAFVGSDYTLVGIDLATGNRSEVSGFNAGIGPIVPIGWLAHDATNHRFFMGGLDHTIVAADEITGDRALLANAYPLFGAGPEPTLSCGLAWDGVRVVDCDGGLDGVLAIDPATHARTFLSGYPIGAGTRLASPERVVHLEGSSKTVVFDSFRAAILSIDVPTGARSVVSDMTIGAGPFLAAAGDIAAVGGTVFAGEGFGMQRIDLATGDRATLSGGFFGLGPGFVNGVVAIVPNGAGTTLWVKELAANRVLSVDPTTGDRAIVADVNTGVGPDLTAALDLASDGTRLFAILPDRVLEIDPASGDRGVFSGPGVGAGPALSVHEGFVDGGRLLLVADAGGMVAVDLTSGDRVAVPSEPGGFAIPKHAHADGSGVVYAVDDQLGALVAFDTVTGEAVIVSK